MQTKKPSIFKRRPFTLAFLAVGMLIMAVSSQGGNTLATLPLPSAIALAILGMAACFVFGSLGDVLCVRPEE